MYISNYQMHNVLKIYTRQLKRGPISERQKATGGRSLTDNIRISSQAKRQNVINQVATNIVERITSNGPQTEFDREIVDRLKDETDGKNIFNQRKNAEFVYNVINGDRQKTTNRLSVKDSNFLVKRLEQLAEEEVNQNMASLFGPDENMY
jgi:hypothetical protein